MTWLVGGVVLALVVLTAVWCGMWLDDDVAQGDVWLPAGLLCAELFALSYVIGQVVRPWLAGVLQ